MFPILRRALVVCVALIPCLAARTWSAPPSLQTFVLAAAGQSTCGTFGIPAPVSAFFGTAGVSEPVPNFASCSIDGGYDFATLPTGPIFDDRSLTTSWPGHTFTGTTSAWSTYGRVAAVAQGAHTGGTSSLTVTGAEGFGTFEDALTITSPSVTNGANGSLTLLVTASGHLSTTGSGYSDVELRYQINGGSIVTLFRSQAANAVSLPFITSQTGTDLGGFALSLGAMSGSGELSTTSIPFVYGTSFVLKLGLLSYAVPRLTSSNECDFAALVTGIQVRGPVGQTVSDFSISSTSGAAYGSGGVTPVANRTPRAPMSLTAFPNPSSAEVELRGDGAIPADAYVEIFDVAGRRVRELSASNRASNDAIRWDGRDGRGARLPSGTYFVRMTSRAGVTSTRVTLLR